MQSVEAIRFRNQSCKIRETQVQCFMRHLRITTLQALSFPSLFILTQTKNSYRTLKGFTFLLKLHSKKKVTLLGKTQIRLTLLQWLLPGSCIETTSKWMKRMWSVAYTCLTSTTVCNPGRSKCRNQQRRPLIQIIRGTSALVFNWARTLKKWIHYWSPTTAPSKEPKPSQPFKYLITRIIHTKCSKLKRAARLVACLGLEVV